MRLLFAGPCTEEFKRVENEASDEFLSAEHPPASNPMETTIVLFVPQNPARNSTTEALSQAGLRFDSVRDFAELLERLEQPCGALLLAEESLDAMRIHRLVEHLSQQPLWSDLPVLVLLDGGEGREELFAQYKNVTLLEQPVRPISLGSTVEAILRSRQQQYRMRAMLDERENLRAEMDEAQQAKTQFLAALSHELRTPLSPVLMTVAALRQDPAVSDHMQQDLEVIQRNVELEARLIDDLLDLNQLTSGKLALRTEVLDVHRLLQRAVEHGQESGAAQRQQRIEVRYEAAEHFTRGECARLQQIFGHLLVNASKFSPPGSCIEVATRNPQSGALEILITDFGVGIEPALLPKLFDAFQQGQPLMARCGGLGLGLAISKTLAELHGGRLRARSAGPGHGSTFVLELNTVAEPKAAAGQRLAAEDGAVKAAQVPARPELNILLVEDHEPTRRALHRLLTQAGHRVTEAANVAGALDSASRTQFDLLMSDLGLPDASGLELMRELANRYQIPGIALSGFGMEEDIQASRKAGFCEHFTKPVDWRRLKESVYSVAGKV